KTIKSHSCIAGGYHTHQHQQKFLPIKVVFCSLYRQKKTDNSERQSKDAVCEQHKRHVLLHNYYCSTVGKTKFLLISSIIAKIASIPCFFSAEVRKIGGTSSNQVRSDFLNFAIF